MHIVTNLNRGRFKRQIDQMHRDRKRLFVDRLRWDVTVVDGEFEIDEFDTDRAIYLIETDRATTKHVGSVRFLPTTEPHILSTVFSSLCDGPVPVGEDIMELTRLCVSPDLSKTDTVSMCHHMWIASVEFALLFGISHRRVAGAVSLVTLVVWLGNRAAGPSLGHRWSNYGGSRDPNYTGDIAQSAGAILIPVSGAGSNTTDAGRLNRLPRFDHWNPPMNECATAKGKSASQWCEGLTQHGYCIVEDLALASLANAFHDDLRGRLDKTPFSVGEFHSERSKRCGSLLKRSIHAERFVLHPLIMDIVDRILRPYCDCLRLNLTQTIQLHPGAEAQPPHRDHDLWRAMKGEMEFQVNVMWSLTDFTADNGATVIWPRSHKRPSKFLIDPAESISAEMKPGSALVFLGSVLHCGGANRLSRLA